MTERLSDMRVLKRDLYDRESTVQYDMMEAYMSLSHDIWVRGPAFISRRPAWFVILKCLYIPKDMSLKLRCVRNVRFSFPTPKWDRLLHSFRRAYSLLDNASSRLLLQHIQMFNSDPSFFIYATGGILHCIFLFHEVS